MSNPMAEQSNAELPLEDDSKAKPFTTAQVNSMLWNKYTEKGEYVLLFDVPNVVGTRQERRCDAVALGMWQSTGRLIHGFEIKVSRADWLREVKDVSKADHFMAQCDRWWLVTGDHSIAKSEEIPDAWGWMTATRTGLRIQRPPKPLHADAEQMKRLWAFALIRRAADRGDINAPELQAILAKNRAEVDRRAEEHIKSVLAGSAPAFERLKKEVADFETASGMKLTDWRLGNVGKLARKLNSIAEDGYSGFTNQLTGQLRALKLLQKSIAEALAAVGDPALLKENENDD